MMQKDIEKLDKKNGKDFDKAYVDMMVDDHERMWLNSEKQQTIVQIQH
jgi:predicted outer membrane protein